MMVKSEVEVYPSLIPFTFPIHFTNQGRIVPFSIGPVP